MSHHGPEAPRNDEFKQDVVHIPGAEEIEAQEIMGRGELECNLLEWQINNTDMLPAAVVDTINFILNHQTLSVRTLETLATLATLATLWSPYEGRWTNADGVTERINARLALATKVKR